MTTDGKTDIVIHRGRHLATVEPLNETARKYMLLNISGVEPTGMYTVHMDYLEDVVQQYHEENFIVEVR